MACVSRVSCAREVSRFGRVGKCVKTKVGLTAEIIFWEFFKHFSRNQRVTLDTELALSECRHVSFKDDTVAKSLSNLASLSNCIRSTM